MPTDMTRASLDELREAAASCTACGLWRNATQTVFGRGPEKTRLVLVGEQPGDAEDLAGEPFVGPAGKLLDRALDEADIDRGDVYLTNVVKHFKWRPSAGGARRIHDKPSWTEVGACLPWLEGELNAIQPELVVCLGATAAQALLGRSFRVTRERGKVVESQLGIAALATVHPSSILRAPDESARKTDFAAFVADLRAAAAVLENRRPRRGRRERRRQDAQARSR